MLEDQAATKGFKVLRKQTEGDIYPSDLCAFLKLLRADIYVCFMLQIHTVMRETATLLVSFKDGNLKNISKMQIYGTYIRAKDGRTMQSYSQEGKT